MKLLALASAVLLVGLSACASGERGAGARATDPATVARSARGVAVFDGASGEQLGWESMVERAAGADVIVIGENHGHPLGLASAAALWEDVLARTDTAALAMEFFERDEQLALDDYLGGVTNEAQFRGAAGRNEGNYPPGHRAMVEAAKRAGAPVIAANGPRRYVRMARLEGFDRLRGMTEEQRRTVRVPDELIGGRYREEFDKLMVRETGDDGKPLGEAELREERARAEAMFRSQQVWDWTMAESVVRGVESGRRPVVLVVGRFHSDFRGGTVQAIERLRPGTRVAVVSMVNDDAGPTVGEEDRGRGDFVLYVGPSAEVD